MEINHDGNRFDHRDQISARRKMQRRWYVGRRGDGTKLMRGSG